MSAALDNLISDVKSARDAATLERASFGGLSASRIKLIDQIDAPEVEVNDYIKDMVELHHKTWIIRPLEKVLAQLEDYRELIEKVEKLKKVLDEANIEQIASLAQGGKKE